MGAMPVAALLGWGTALVLHAELGRRASRTARVCHEVRGPLTAAGLALHAASRRGTDAVLPAVEAELARASAAVDDLFAAGVAPLRPVDLVALVRERAPAWQAVAGRLVVGLPDGPVVVEGDAVRLAQALGNLVANAARHGAPPIELDVRRRGGRVTIDVRDHGPGLGAPLAALGGRRRSRGRHGHGLAVARDVAAAHGGSLAAVPCAAGARLRLELPASAHPVRDDRTAS